MSQIFYHRIVFQIKLHLLRFFLIKWILMEFCSHKLNTRQNFLPYLFRNKKKSKFFEMK